MQKNKWKGMGQLVSIAVLVLMVFLCFHIKKQEEYESLSDMIVAEVKSVMFRETAKQYAMQLDYMLEDDQQSKTASQMLLESVRNLFPVYGYINGMGDYETQVESKFSYEEIVAQEAADEMEVEDGTTKNTAQEEQDGCKNMVNTIENTVNSTSTSDFKLSETPQTEFPLDKLNDFDYLIQNFYIVDKTTTITSSELNASDMLAKSMKLTTTSDQPQILIYHTHSQEGYVDSVPGDSSTTVVGVGEYLSQLLRDRYGLNVLHHTGEYDVEDRDNAYAAAAPALEQLLADNPSIEVVIDLHRDGVAEGTRLVTEVNGKQMASIMFFNGLSRTTATGDISYLYNPNLPDNLAFSFQMQLMAEEYYPGLSRAIYLKGYRYNLHYCPKSLLVEVGAQTNTVEEAMSAMEPLADVLYRVLCGS